MKSREKMQNIEITHPPLRHVVATLLHFVRCGVIKRGTTVVHFEG